MASEAEHLIDRSRLRRKLTFWRIAAIVALAIAVIGIGAMAAGETGLDKTRPHIAQIRIEGTIMEDEELLDRIAEVAESDMAKGVIVTIDSPGGTTAGGEAIYEAVRDLAQKKPTVAQVGTLAASAGYMIATATDHIVARQSSIVGSIGVIFQYPDISGLLDKVGVEMNAIKSAPLKAEPSIFGDAPEESKQMIARMIMDSFEWFKALVDERRPLSRPEVDRIADGSVFTGRQALANKLVDALGGEETAKAWLAGKGVDGDLDIVEWKRKPEDSLVPFPAARLLGLGGGNAMEKLGDAALELAEPVLLDGLVSVWHGNSKVIDSR